MRTYNDEVLAFARTGEDLIGSGYNETYRLIRTQTSKHPQEPPAYLLSIVQVDSRFLATSQQVKGHAPEVCRAEAAVFGLDMPARHVFAMLLQGRAVSLS